MAKALDGVDEEAIRKLSGIEKDEFGFVKYESNVDAEIAQLSKEIPQKTVWLARTKNTGFGIDVSEKLEYKNGKWNVGVNEFDTPYDAAWFLRKNQMAIVGENKPTKEQGVKAYDKEYGYGSEKIGDLSKRVEAKNISEAYHKAKVDGSNPELVKAVEDLLGKQKESSPTPQTGKDIGGELLNSVNPTGGVFSNYSAEEIDKLPLGENITTYDKTSNKKQDEKITVYRGVPKDASDDIVSGDFVTTNKKLAQDYAGTGKVISKEVRADEILDDKTEPLGEEYILRQKPLTEGAKDIPSEDWSRDVESTA